MEEHQNRQLVFKLELSAILCILFLSDFQVIADDNVNWFATISGEYEELGENIATDLNGHVAVTGNFVSDTLIIGENVIKNNGNTNLFFAVIDSQGSFPWSQNGNGSLLIGNTADVVFDNNGSFVFVGTFRDSGINFSINGTYLMTSNKMEDGGYGQDIFMVKYTPTGNLIWAKTIGGSAAEEAMSISIDKNGEIYITGSFGGNENNFDPSEGKYTLPYSPNNLDCFIAKYDSDGEILWAKAFGGTNSEIGLDIDVSNSQSVFVSGMFVGDSIDFNPSPEKLILSSLDDTWDGFVLKYSSNGDFIWARNIPASRSAYAYTVKSLNDSSVLVGGCYCNLPNSTINVATTRLDFSSGNTFDAFLCKYDSEGNLLDAGGIRGQEAEYIYNVSLDNNNGIFVVGKTNSQSVDFGLDKISSIKNGNGNQSGFIAHYDFNFNLKDVEILSGTGSCSINGVSLGSIKNRIIIGNIRNGSVFLNDTKIESKSNSDMFILCQDDLQQIVRKPLPHYPFVTIDHRNANRLYKLNGQCINGNKLFSSGIYFQYFENCQKNNIKSLYIAK